MKTRHSLLAWLTLAAVFVIAMPELDAQTPTATRATQRLIEATAPAQRESCCNPSLKRAAATGTTRRAGATAWRGKPCRARNASATTALLRSALNERGLDKVRARDGAGDRAARAGDVRPFARPRELRARDLRRARRGGWGWRIEGHHLSLHFSCRATATLSRCRSSSAPTRRVVPRDFGGGAPRAGFRLLGSEEDLARAVARDSLSPQQRGSAIFDTRPVRRHRQRATRRAPRPPGCHWASPSRRWTPAQQAQLLKLIAAFADHLQPELAQARLARVCARHSVQSCVSAGPAPPSRGSRITFASRARQLPDRVRQLGRQPHPLGVARLRRRLRPRRAAPTTTAARRAPRTGTANAERMQRDVLGR